MMEQGELTTIVEFSSDFQERALNTTSYLLNSPEAAKIKVENFMSSDMKDQIILKTIDEASHTAFHIESGYAAGSTDRNAKKTVISWFTLGEDKGDLPRGSIEILESDGEKKIFGFKMDNPFFTDEGYLWGDSRDVIDRTNEMEVRGSQVAISEEQASQLLARLQSSKPNKEYTEATAQIMDSENRFIEALVEFQSVKSAGVFEKLLKNRPARKKLVDAVTKYKEVEEELDNRKRKKEQEQAQETQGQQEDTQ